ncbi:MAPEG family protein [Nannocystis pusilla]|uniref:MAPEG family protein n=1 Tax=Nannocystis pusilla TaxID=889268 RepID=A0A9X3EK18_9BACT|nr:MAPEG family protein [Nannocystis pusilla]MCY1005482.1 MAPEG family protein [Nannocystis pusilla]
MHTPLLCLLGFGAWTLLVAVLGIVTPRVLAVAMGTAPEGGFPADVPHGSDRYRRTMRAHLNCVENLPLFAAVVLTGAVVHAGSPRMDTLAIAYLAARVAQTVIHIASGSAAAVKLRFTAFAVQAVCLVWMGVLVARALGAAAAV